MVRGLQWASGRLVELDAADEMIAVVEQFLQVQNITAVKRAAICERQPPSGFAARLLVELR
ncbi:hypothetical protein M9458_048387, partial [Cirrhinus mrigala]